MRIRILTAVILACLVALPGIGESKAVLKNVQGKVEVKPLKGTWTAAKDGMEVSLMDTISTGFNSSAELKLEDNIVQVSPLTRLTLDKLLEQSGTLSTNLYLKVGKVTADVKSSKGLSQDFKVQSAYSTASVRGTKLIYDGVTLTVVEGNVNLIVGAPKRDFSQYLQKVIEERKGEKKEEEVASSGTTEGTVGGTTGGTGGTGGTTEGSSEETGEAVDKEEVRVETVVDMEQLSKEEVAEILQEAINELVQSGDLDQESAAQVLETVTKVLENPQQAVEEIPVPEENIIKVETGGTQSVTVPTAKQDVFIIKPQTQVQAEAAGGASGVPEPPKQEQTTTARTKTRGSISIELEVK